MEVEVRSARAAADPAPRPDDRRGGRRRRSSGPAKAVWFNQAWLADRLRPGTRLLLHGKLEPRGLRVAEHEFVDGERRPPESTRPGSCRCIPATERLRPQRIREWAWQAHAAGPRTRSSRCRPSCARAAGWPAPADALATAHFPGSLAERGARPRAARVRGALPVPGGARGAARQGRQATDRASRSAAPGELVERWLGSLPFELTGDQRRAIEEIDADLGRGAADAAAADGGGGLAARRWSPSTRCCARSRPGTRPR